MHYQTSRISWLANDQSEQIGIELIRYLSHAWSRRTGLVFLHYYLRRYSCSCSMASLEAFVASRQNNRTFWGCASFPSARDWHSKSRARSVWLKFINCNKLSDPRSKIRSCSHLSTKFLADVFFALHVFAPTSEYFWTRLLWSQIDKWKRYFQMEGDVG